MELKCNLKINKIIDDHSKIRQVGIVKINNKNYILKTELKDRLLKEYIFYKKYSKQIYNDNFNIFINTPIKMKDCGNKIYYLMNLIDFDFDNNFIAKITFNQWKDYTIQLCISIYYLNHHLHIFHNDLCYKNKLRNIMLKNNNKLKIMKIDNFHLNINSNYICIIDFGYYNIRPNFRTLQFYDDDIKINNKNIIILYSEVFIVFFYSYYHFYYNNCINDNIIIIKNKIYNEFIKNIKNITLIEFDLFIINSLINLKI